MSIHCLSTVFMIWDVHTGLFYRQIEFIIHQSWSIPYNCIICRIGRVGSRSGRFWCFYLLIICVRLDLRVFLLILLFSMEKTGTLGKEPWILRDQWGIQSLISSFVQDLQCWRHDGSFKRKIKKSWLKRNLFLMIEEVRIVLLSMVFIL